VPPPPRNRVARWSLKNMRKVFGSKLSEIVLLSKVCIKCGQSVGIYIHTMAILAAEKKSGKLETRNDRRWAELKTSIYKFPLFLVATKIRQK
jgi:hypothetical protein